jgi:hypothetical protein
MFLWLLRLKVCNFPLIAKFCLSDRFPRTIAFFRSLLSLHAFKFIVCKECVNRITLKYIFGTKLDLKPANVMKSKYLLNNKLFVFLHILLYYTCLMLDWKMQPDVDWKCMEFLRGNHNVSTRKNRSHFSKVLIMFFRTLNSCVADLACLKSDSCIIKRHK